LPYYFIEDLFIGGWMADRCLLPKVDIKEGFNMLPHLVGPPENVKWNYDKIFHYIDSNFKIKVHHFLMKSLANNITNL
jgi:hypothetical protein